MLVSAAARDSPDRAKAGFRPDSRHLARRAFEEPLDRHVGILEPDAIGPPADHARYAPPLAPAHGNDLIRHERASSAGARRLAASCASHLRSTRTMPRRAAPSMIRGQYCAGTESRCRHCRTRVGEHPASRANARVVGQRAITSRKFGGGGVISMVVGMNKRYNEYQQKAIHNASNFRYTLSHA